MSIFEVGLLVCIVVAAYAWLHMLFAPLERAIAEERGTRRTIAQEYVDKADR